MIADFFLYRIRNDLRAIRASLDAARESLDAAKENGHDLHVMSDTLRSIKGILDKWALERLKN